MRPKRVAGRTAALFFLAVLIARPVQATTIWIDTDPSIGLPFREVDDAFALALAFRSPEVEIAGISTTYGNASLAATTRIGQDLVARFGKPMNVYPGANSREDLGKQTLASDALARILVKSRLTYLALGPLTNLATFQKLHPNLVERIDRVIAVGGLTTNGKLSVGPMRLHDANVFKDPAAMAFVLQSKSPISLAPIETSIHLLMTATDLQIMRRSAAGEFLYRRSRLWEWFWRRIARMEGGPLFDALPVLAVAHPDFIQVDQRYAGMNNTGELMVQTTPGEGMQPILYYSAIKPQATRFIRDRLAAP